MSILNLCSPDGQFWQTHWLNQQLVKVWPFFNEVCSPLVICITVCLLPIKGRFFRDRRKSGNLRQLQSYLSNFGAFRCHPLKAQMFEVCPKLSLQGDIIKWTYSCCWGGQAYSRMLMESWEPYIDFYKPKVATSVKFVKLTLGTIAPQFKGTCEWLTTESTLNRWHDLFDKKYRYWMVPTNGSEVWSCCVHHLVISINIFDWPNSRRYWSSRRSWFSFWQGFTSCTLQEMKLY
jgi:hypothetical protein